MPLTISPNIWIQGKRTNYYLPEADVLPIKGEEIQIVSGLQDRKIFKVESVVRNYEVAFIGTELLLKSIRIYCKDTT